MNKTSIEWADYVWNPVTGCTKVSEGCRNCYAEAIARRFWRNGINGNNYRPFSEVRCHPERLDQPMKVKKGGRVFVNSMSDLFHPDVPFEFIYGVWSVISETPQHTYIILTKRPAEMRHRLSNLAVRNNVWIGVSVEDQQTADERIPILLDTQAEVRFVSVEPMLGPVDLHLHDYAVSGTKHSVRRTFLDWVICGAESGPRRRPMRMDWAQSLRDQCVEASAPFFFKQMQVDGKMTSMPALDGRVWDQYPVVAHA